jgi:hypothetical protein
MEVDQRGPLPLSVFQRTLAEGRSGIATSQNLLGFMLFHGEGAMADPTAARFWFQVAAENGSAAAQMNLAVMHALGAGVQRIDSVAERYLRLALANPDRPRHLSPSSLEHLVHYSCDSSAVRWTPGSEVFGVFCAGCHGVNGIAEYEAAPSFALGERMDKSDEDLLASVEGGHQDMPQWSEKLPRRWLIDALGHARGLADDFRHGTLHRLRELPELTFRFGPMNPEIRPQDPERTVGIEPPLPSLGEFCDQRVRSSGS